MRTSGKVSARDKVLFAALKLFAKRGYEGVSLSEIADELGLTKPAMYRHFKSKEDLFAQILKRMEENDASNAEEANVPVDSAANAPESYESISIVDMGAFSASMFRYWVTDEFAEPFRKLLTVEQFRTPQMLSLYHQYLGQGPVDYVTEILKPMFGERAAMLAGEFYAPMHLYYSLTDNAQNKEETIQMALDAIQKQTQRLAMIKLQDNGLTLRLEKPEDENAVENLIRESFWNIYRPGCLEHYVAHVLRDDPDFIPELNFVLEKDGEIIGQAMYVHAQITKDDGSKVPVLTMGPIAILPKYQRQGFGKLLLETTLTHAQAFGGAVLFEGNIQFYGKSGFVLASSKQIHYWAEPKESDVPYFLCKELKAGFLEGIEGTYQTPKVYLVNESDAEAFDAQFPPKVKERRPGQLC